MLNVVSEGPATRSSYSTRNLEKFRSATTMQEEPTTDRSATTWGSSWLSSRVCATCTTIMPTQKLIKLQIFEENFSTNLWKSFLVQFQTTCLIQNRGSKPHVVSPKNGPSQSQHKYLERKPLNCRSIILVHTHVHYQVLHIFWSQAWRQSSCFESLPTPHPNFHLRMLDPRLLSILLISFWLALLFAQLHLHCTSR